MKPVHILGQTPILGLNNDPSELELLTEAAKTGSYMVYLGMVPAPKPMELAFDTALENEWLAWMDMRPVPAPPQVKPPPPGGMLMGRVFRITKQGRARLAELQGKKVIDDAVKRPPGLVMP